MKKEIRRDGLVKLGCTNKHRTTPAGWGIGMTVGIAAITHRRDEEAIIFATDQMMSVGIRTADLPLVTKGFAIHPRWFTVWAGTVTFVTPVLQKVGEVLKTIPDPDLSVVSSTFVSAKIMKKVETEVGDELRPEYDLRVLRVRRLGRVAKDSAMSSGRSLTWPRRSRTPTR